MSINKTLLSYNVLLSVMEYYLVRTRYSINITIMFSYNVSLSVMEYYIRVIPQGTADNNLGLDRKSRFQGSRSQLLQTTNLLIARPLFGSPNCAW